MTIPTARSITLGLVLCLTLVGCGASDDPAPTAEPSVSSSVSASTAQQDAQSELNELAIAASERASEPPTLLLVANSTSGTVTLTSADGQNTATVAAGKSLRLVSERVCDWLPLTASSADGRVIERYAQPCQGQTWTITAPGR